MLEIRLITYGVAIGVTLHVAIFVQQYLLNKKATLVFRVYLPSIHYSILKHIECLRRNLTARILIQVSTDGKLK